MSPRPAGFFGGITRNAHRNLAITRHDDKGARAIGMNEFVVASAPDIHPSLAHQRRDDAPRLGFQGTVPLNAYYSV